MRAFASGTEAGRRKELTDDGIHLSRDEWDLIYRVSVEESAAGGRSRCHLSVRGCVRAACGMRWEPAASPPPGPPVDDEASTHLC